MGEMKDSFQKYIEERLASPLWGYLLVAMITCNWKPLSVLFFSKDKIQDRITSIATTADYAWSLWAPLLAGISLAIVSPYLHRSLSVLHNGAEIWKEKSANKLLLRELKNKRIHAKERVKTANAEELEDKREATKRSLQEARTTKVNLRIDAMKKERDELFTTIASTQKEIETLKEQGLFLRKDVDELIDRCLDVIDLIDELQSISNSKDVAPFKTRIRLLFNDDEISRAKQRRYERENTLTSDAKSAGFSKKKRKREELNVISKQSRSDPSVNGGKIEAEIEQGDITLSGALNHSDEQENKTETGLNDKSSH